MITARPELALRALEQGARAAPARAGSTRVVVIDGPSGSGKTTLAIGLGERLAAPVVHMDDLYRGWDGLDDGAERLAEWVLAPLAAGEPARYRRYDWTAGAYGDWVEVPAAPFLVVEGAGAGSRTGAPFTALLAWVDAPDAVRRERAFARDGDLYRPHWDGWAAQERVTFAREGTRARAGIVIEPAAETSSEPAADAAPGPATERSS